MKDRCRNKRYAAHRAKVRVNTKNYKFYCDGRLVREMNLYVPDVLSRCPPWSNKKFRKILKLAGIKPRGRHIMVLSSTANSVTVEFTLN